MDAIHICNHFAADATNTVADQKQLDIETCPEDELPPAPPFPDDYVMVLTEEVFRDEMRPMLEELRGAGCDYALWFDGVNQPVQSDFCFLIVSDHKFTADDLRNLDTESDPLDYSI